LDVQSGHGRRPVLPSGTVIDQAEGSRTARILFEPGVAVA